MRQELVNRSQKYTCRTIVKLWIKTSPFDQWQWKGYHSLDSSGRLPRLAPSRCLDVVRRIPLLWECKFTRRSRHPCLEPCAVSPYDRRALNPASIWTLYFNVQMLVSPEVTSVQKDALTAHQVLDLTPHQGKNEDHSFPLDLGFSGQKTQVSKSEENSGPR